MTIKFDNEIEKISDYCFADIQFSNNVINEASYALMDAMACAILALNNLDYNKHTQPVIHHFTRSSTDINSIAIPGTPHYLDLFQSSYVLGCMIRWLDFNDTWLAKEWGHPSDNLAALLPAIIFHQKSTGKTITLSTLIDALIKSYEIQGILALDNSFNQRGFDHVILVKLASTALSTKLIGGNKEQCNKALSNAFLDGASLRTFRHKPNTGWRKSWAAANSSRQALQHAFNSVHGEMGYPQVLSDKDWGFNHIILNEVPFASRREYTDYVMTNILYKISYPIEFHAQTAVECAIKLHDTFKNRYHCDIQNIESITLATHEPALRIINKNGPLTNPADRDHCIQYGIAVALLFGDLTSNMYSDEFSKHADIDKLRDKIIIYEDNDFTKIYYAEDKRAIANRVTIQYMDTQIDTMEILYPLGHKKRRSESRAALKSKFTHAINSHFSKHSANEIIHSFNDTDKLLNYSILDWLSLWVREK